MTIVVDDVRLDGIPCRAELGTWPAEPQTWWEPGCDAGWELIQVLDRKGYKAPWLERKLENKKIRDAFEDSVNEELDRKGWEV